MELLESNRFANYKIDKENGIIFNVKVLGEESKNGYAYPRTLRESLSNSLEGMKVNINHTKKANPGKDVPLEARFGQLKNIVCDDDGTYADLHYLRTHPMAATIVESAERMPEVLGLSIFGKGSDKGKRNKNGKLIIESCILNSVDLVADPGTVNSLFESEDVVEEVVQDDKVKYEQLNLELEHLKTEKSCRVLCESLDVPVDEHILNVLSKLDEQTRKEHLNYIKRKSVVKTIKSTGNIDINSNTDWANKLRG